MKHLPIAGGLIALALSASAAAADITISDAYARSASPAAKSGAAFMVIENSGAEDDRLIDAASEAAAMVELHTHSEDPNGMMVMREVEDGFAIPAGGAHTLARGGDHVMFMGLTEGWSDGDTIPVTLTFEQAGEIEVEIVVDTERMPEGHGDMDHGDMDHGSN